MHPRNAHRHPNKKCDWTRQQIARAARPRSSLWRPTRTSRTPSCRARALNVLSRRDRGQSRNRTRQRSCGALKEHTVSACEQAARVRSAAAHRVPRRCPATAGPPSEALKDRGPAKQRGPQRWRCRPVSRGPGTKASLFRQTVNMDVVTSLLRRKSVYTLSPQYGLSVTSIPGSQTSSQTRLLLHARQFSHQSIHYQIDGIATGACRGAQASPLSLCVVLVHHVDAYCALR